MGWCPPCWCSSLSLSHSLSCSVSLLWVSVVFSLCLLLVLLVSPSPPLSLLGVHACVRACFVSKCVRRPNFCLSLQWETVSAAGGPALCGAHGADAQRGPHSEVPWLPHAQSLTAFSFPGPASSLLLFHHPLVLVLFLPRSKISLHKMCARQLDGSSPDAVSRNVRACVRAPLVP